MKKRIYLYFCSITLVAVVLTSVLTLLAFYSFFDTQVKNNVKSEAELLAKSLNYTENNQDYIASLSFAQGQRRVTIIESDGVVSFDSYTDVTTMQPHNDREEIAQAFSSGTGSATRYSDTLGEKTYYYAIKLNDGSVLRLASTTSGIYSIFIKILPLILILIIIGFLICVYLAKLLTTRIISPIEKISENIENVDSYYDELSPFITKIGHQSAELKQQEDILQEQKNTLNIITDNMNEGLILLDKNSIILSSNRSAATLLGSFDENYEGKSLVTMCRDLEFIEAIRIASTGQAHNFVMNINQKHIEIFASPITFNDELKGIAIFIVDITDKQAAEKMRREFSANVSHELKTPLTSISGYAEMLANDMVSKDNIKVFSEKIYTESNRLVNLIEDIISLSRLDEALIDKEFSMISIAETAKLVCDNLDFLAKEKNVSLEITGTDRKILASPSMIYELINNLVENAIKYNVANGSVKVNIFPDKITVSDTGIGIESEHLDRIFERFYRVDKSRSKKTGGTGLGLAIVKHIASYHEATVSVTSELNIGTTITVTL